LFAGAIVVLVAGLWAGEERINAPSTGPIESPTGSFPEIEPQLGRSIVYPEFSQEVFFPGNGEFTALARSIHGFAAIGRQFIGSSGFVWTANPTAEEWTRRQIEVAERAFLGDVVAFVDGFYIGGAIVGPGMGSSIPTLWGGSVDRDFTVLDHPFAGPGRIDALRVIGGELYVIGQGSAPFSDTLRPGTARVPRLVAQRAEGWVDLTPTGSNVIVTDVVGFEDGIVAAGADADQALVWWQPDSAADWVVIEVGVPRGVVTDIATHPEVGLVASVRTWDSDGTVRTQIFRAETPRGWVAEGEPLRRDIGWIEPVTGGVLGGPIGGSENRGVWGYGFGIGWEPIEYRSAPGGTVARGMGETLGGVLFGGDAGQPVLWSGSPTPYEPGITVPGAQEVWEFVTHLPGHSTQVVHTGRHLVAYGSALDPGTVWTSVGDQPWRGVEVVPGFGISGVNPRPGGLLLFGETTSLGVVYDISDDGTWWDVRILPDMSIRHASVRGTRTVVLGVGDDGPERIELSDGEVVERTLLASLPVRIIEHDGVLIGTGSARPIPELAISTDMGSTWRTFDVPVFTAGVSSGRLVVVTADRPRRILVLDPVSLELVEVVTADAVTFGSTESPGSALMTWGGGVAAHGPSILRVTDDLSGETVTVPLDVEDGMRGVFLSPIPGPGGYALVAEAGQTVIYRWSGVAEDETR
jgi:hypothetical protein